MGAAFFMSMLTALDISVAFSSYTPNWKGEKHANHVFIKDRRDDRQAQVLCAEKTSAIEQVSSIGH